MLIVRYGFSEFRAFKTWLMYSVQFLKLLMEPVLGIEFAPKITLDRVRFTTATMTTAAWFRGSSFRSAAILTRRPHAPFCWFAFNFKSCEQKVTQANLREERIHRGDKNEAIEKSLFTKLKSPRFVLSWLFRRLRIYVESERTGGRTWRSRRLRPQKLDSIRVGNCTPASRKGKILLGARAQTQHLSSPGCRDRVICRKNREKIINIITLEIQTMGGRRNEKKKRRKEKINQPPKKLSKRQNGPSSSHFLAHFPHSLLFVISQPWPILVSRSRVNPILIAHQK